MTASWKPSTRTSGRFHSVRLVAETGSTNRDLVREAAEGASAGSVLIARHQTAGRGRQGRSWFDHPDSSLLMSWSIDIDASLAPLLPLVTGTAVCRAIEPFAGTNAAALKWPNDVLVPSHGERKLVGILAEVANVERPVRSGVARSGDASLRVIVGMGMNIDLALDDAPAEVAERAIDLQTMVGSRIDRAGLVDSILDACDEAVNELETSTVVALDSYRARCLTIGRSVRFETPTGELSGEVVSIADNGSLVLRAHDGEVHHLTAGDAHHIASSRLG